MTSGSSVGPQVRCIKCDHVLPERNWKWEEATICPFCYSKIHALFFPAFFRGVAPGRAAETILVEGDAGCFYHPQKKAELSCENCGRFLCALCDVDWNSKHLCPPCIQTGKQAKTFGALEGRRILYDHIALSLAILPLLIFYFTIVTAPVVLYIGIRYWNTPCSIVRQSKIRFAVAILLAGAQIAGWSVLLYFLISRW